MIDASDATQISKPNFLLLLRHYSVGYIVMLIVFGIMMAIVEWFGVRISAFSFGTLLLISSGCHVGDKYVTINKQRPSSRMAWKISSLTYVVTLIACVVSIYLLFITAPDAAAKLGEEVDGFIIIILLAAGFIVHLLMVRLGISWGVRLNEVRAKKREKK
ncbi:MAG: ABZJ_00895 family protein [Candidatus Puniceispirillaceae bacterium]